VEILGLDISILIVYNKNILIVWFLSTIVDRNVTHPHTMLNFLKNGKGEILNLFFKDEEKEYFLREIARILQRDASATQRYLEALIDEGILKDERKGNLRFFKLNKNYPLYEEIKKIISKTLGLEYKVKRLIENLKQIEYAFIYGSIAKNEEYSESDIDLLLIGKADQDVLIKKINKLEEELGREINYQLFAKEQLIKKLKNKEPFFIRIFNEPIIILKGDLYEFTRIIKQ